MIRIEKLKKTYDEKEVLKELTINISKGAKHGVLGPNGCGKSTLVKCILGLVQADCGSIFIDGKNINESVKYRNSIGYMPQTPSFPDNLSAEEIFQMLADVRRQIPTKKDELISLFELQPHLEKPFEALSGGTKQKVSAVSALMFAPDLLILDEPTVGLDPIASHKLKTILLQNTEQTLLLVSHIVSEMQQMVNSLTYLHEGSVVFAGTPQSLCQLHNTTELEQAIVLQMEKSYARN